MADVVTLPVVRIERSPEVEIIDREYYEGVIAEMREAMDMASARLEYALQDEAAYRHWVELARSYLSPPRS